MTTSGALTTLSGSFCSHGTSPRPTLAASSHGPSVSRLKRGRSPTAEDVALLRKEALRAASRAELAVAGGHGQWIWRVGEDLEYPVGALARSAVELLTTAEELSRLRECASETCQWLFLDRSKSRTRRWCDMRDCGNRAKARRFYERTTRAKRRARS
ncbi:MAG: hypothetical protein E6H94_00220 [Chloroflexi bacterium]|nr:MAG: hypothetical protein E6H94_00220 [Chloroflexota bacterium]